LICELKPMQKAPGSTMTLPSTTGGTVDEPGGQR
jgi:hypothetical protein